MSEYDVRKVMVIGAGFMGSGIAQVSAAGGFEVMIYDADENVTAKAVDNMRWSLEKLKGKGKLAEAPEDVMGRLQKAESLDKAAEADVVIEAVYEDEGVKGELFETLNRIVRDDAVIGSNTSSIPMEKLSTRLKKPGRFIGMHFFGPVPLMELLELVMGPETSDETLETAKWFARKVGKTPIVVRKPSPGFLVNRIFNAAAFEAMRCYAEGVGTPEDIDTGMRLGYGWTAGPFEVLDNAGLDVVAGIFKTIGLDPPGEIRQKLEQGHLGRKTGEGFYRYDGPWGKRIK